MLFSRQETVLKQDDVESAAHMPHLTFCPVFVDSIFWPLKGFKNKELTFEKFDIAQRKTILLRDYHYKG